MVECKYKNCNNENVEVHQIIVEGEPARKLGKSPFCDEHITMRFNKTFEIMKKYADG